MMKPTDESFCEGCVAESSGIVLLCLGIPLD